MKILLASNNPHKLSEMKEVLPEGIELNSLKEMNIHQELPENQDTIEGNALEKAQFIAQNYNVNCISEDTGLLVDALDGSPGVRTARFAGENATDKENIAFLLNKLENVEDRSAYFKTVICLYINKEPHYFKGICRGRIAEEVSGKGGFGYDPIFIPEGYNQTFAELGSPIKSQISHRSKAVQKMVDFVKSGL